MKDQKRIEQPMPKCDSCLLRLDCDGVGNLEILIEDCAEYMPDETAKFVNSADFA